MFISNGDELKKSFFDGENFFLKKFDLAAFLPWFLCEVPQFDDDCEEAICTITRVISNVDDLVNMANDQKIDKTYVVIPGHLINEDNWSLFRLKSIHHSNYIDDGSKLSVYRFETDAGQLIDFDISGMSKEKYNLSFEKMVEFC